MKDHMDNWIVVKSKSGRDKHGFPLGEFICRDGEDAMKLIQDLNIKDAVSSKYLGTCNRLCLSDQLEYFIELYDDTRGLNDASTLIQTDFIRFRLYLSNIITHLRYLCALERGDKDPAEELTP